jgi:hypothetical protein
VSGSGGIFQLMGECGTRRGSNTLLVEELDHRSLERGGIGRDLAVFQLDGQIDTPELRHPTEAFVALARREGSIVRCLCTVSVVRGGRQRAVPGAC